METEVTPRGPEHEKVRIPAVEELVKLGWQREQLQWAPEWRVPQSPHDAAKREDGVSFSSWPVDLVLFESADGVGDWQTVLGLFEFKEPSIDKGLSQLEIYLAREPRAKFGCWSNGSQTAVVYKLPDGKFQTVRNRGLPSPAEDFEHPSVKPITFKDLTVPTGRDLMHSLARVLDIVVARDSRATRSEVQLDQLCNMLLLKLESDIDAGMQPTKPVDFQLSSSSEDVSGKKIRSLFDDLVSRRAEIFQEEGTPQLILDDHTIQEVVYEWSGLNMLEVGPEAVSSAFQVLRRANLKAGEGQYFTPKRVVDAAVRLLDIQPTDKIIDPACGTGGFLIEAFREMASRMAETPNAQAQTRTWAHRQVFGVDKDSINVKLTRAMMLILGDGSAHIFAGDSIREDRWEADYPHLVQPLKDGTFSVVLMNPPFGENLKIHAKECQRNGYSIALASGKGVRYKDLEIGLVFLERAYRLLKVGGRVSIVLPETYFFSSTYGWLTGWLQDRFLLRGMVNIPMEAFQGFCRAKTNLYVFEKVKSNGTQA